MLIPPVAVRFTAPFAKMSPAATIVSVPPPFAVASRLTGPVPLVVSFSLSAIFLAVTDTPVAAVVFSASVPPTVNAPPFSVVVVCPVACTKLAALTPLPVTLFALLIRIAPTRVVLPTSPLNTTSPVVPLVIVSPLPPSSVEKNRTCEPVAPPAVVSIATFPVSTVAEL